ncbi:MAG TPA: FAD-dependent oxidoreductase [Aliidongia sp.]|uniref:NAD(P)/FAD-dependent oxidoreductase n=1 Tax=Aliidongia sp. TaxID=1914230 RepID=UPI002DDD965F|nr:FAD-dependent oxidoreductase [Aliidongia sp.]HEV2675456.1 FAD-dependent oxidoreductase [Aliidongia sp.]
MRIAVVGAGISGLGCAWLLNRQHEITVYEAAERLGGHSNTVDVAGPSGPVAVDTGFIVYNELNYPNLTRLFDHLGVRTKRSIMSLGLSFDDGRLEYAGDTVAGLFAQRRNLLKPAFYGMVAEILRFYRQAPAVLTLPDADSPTLGAYLHRHRYSRRFINQHLLPMAAAIWSCPAEQMLEFPVTSFVRFCDNHGLLKVSDRPDWRTVDGGSREYVARLAAPFADRIRLGAPVQAIRRTGRGVEVTERSGLTQHFDQVVLACHGDQAARMLVDASPSEAEIIGSFRYQRNRAILHRDPKLMPRRRRVWSSWNYLAREQANPSAASVSVTYWMNRLQSLGDAPDLFVSLNPIDEPHPTLVEREFFYDHPVFDQRAMAAQRRLPGLQGAGGVWFCGSYCGWGFHEDGFSAGLAVARALGVEPPWRTAPAFAADAVWPLDGAPALTAFEDAA